MSSRISRINPATGRRNALAYLVEEEDSGASDCLHNSGWGRPPEQYRTAAVGHRAQLDLPALLRAWPTAPDAVREALTSIRPGHEAYPDWLLTAAARTLAARILPASDPTRGVTAPDEASWREVPAATALTELQHAVHAAGLVAGLSVTCQAEIRTSHDADPHHGFAVTDAHVAAALAFTAAARPPVVLWDAEPSLELLAPHRAVAVRWLRPSASPVATRRLWNDLLNARIAFGASEAGS